MWKRFADATPSERIRKIRNRVARNYVKNLHRAQRWHSLKRAGAFGLAQQDEPFIFSTSDDVIGRRVFFKGSFDFAKFEYALRLLGQSRISRLIDVGANIGVITVPAVARGLADRAIAIEPAPLNYNLLECNVRLSGLQDRVRCIQVAATADGDGEALLELSSDNHGDHRIASPVGNRTTHANVIPVASARLDDLVDSPSHSADLLWMDVQGYEVEVLRGAPRLLEAGVPIVLEVWPYGLAEQQSLTGLPEFLSSYRSFVDLSSSDATPRPISAVADLYEEYGLDGAFTDILVLR